MQCFKAVTCHQARAPAAHSRAGQRGACRRAPAPVDACPPVCLPAGYTRLPLPTPAHATKAPTRPAHAHALPPAPPCRPSCATWTPRRPWSAKSTRPCRRARLPPPCFPAPLRSALLLPLPCASLLVACGHGMARRQPGPSPLPPAPERSSPPPLLPPQAAVSQSKPVYISIPSNFAAQKDVAFAPGAAPLCVPPRESVPGAGRGLVTGWPRGRGPFLAGKREWPCMSSRSDPHATQPCPAVPPPPPPAPLPPPTTALLDAAVDRVAAFLNKAQKPVLVVGAHLRSARARAAMVALADASGGRRLWRRQLPLRGHSMLHMPPPRVFAPASVDCPCFCKHVPPHLPPTSCLLCPPPPPQGTPWR